MQIIRVIKGVFIALCECPWFCWSLILSGCQDPSDLVQGNLDPTSLEQPLGRDEDKLTPDSNSQGLLPSFRALERFGIIPFIKPSVTAPF